VGRILVRFCKALVSEKLGRGLEGRGGGVNSCHKGFCLFTYLLLFNNFNA